MIKKLGMQHRGFVFYKVCINGDCDWVNLDLFYDKVKISN